MVQLKKMAAIIAAVAIAVLSTLSTSCANRLELDEYTPATPVSSTYGVDLAFDAPSVSEVTVYFAAEEGDVVANPTLSVPETTQETVTVTFDTAERPAYLYCKGLQNGDSDGVIRIPSDELATKAAAGEPILLVIR